MSLNYIGSKKSLIDFINIPISAILAKNKKPLTILDGFAGTGIIGMHFQTKYKNLNVFANDLEYYSFIINFAQLCVPYSEKLKNIIIEINNSLEDTKSKENYNLIADNYSLKGEAQRMFWTEENAVKADYIKYLLDEFLKKEKIDDNEYKFLNASLLTSIDKVANTASVYGAFLKKFKTSAKHKLELKAIHIQETLNNNKVFNEDINSEVILSQKYDIVYLDPPYNQRQYSSNYHPLNYIAKYDKTIEVYGKTGLLKDSNKSKYCQKKEAFDILSHLVNNLKTRHILLSYNNEGIMDFEKIKELLTGLGKVILYQKVYKKFKSNIVIDDENADTDKNVYEYLFHLDKLEKKEFIIQKID